MARKYEVEITRTQTFRLTVSADSKSQAGEKAKASIGGQVPLTECDAVERVEDLTPPRKDRKSA